MKYSKLKAELGIPERALSRILEYLKDWGLAKKHEGSRFGRWFWYEHVKTYETQEDREIALKHSEELFLGLDAILAEEISLCLQLPHPLAKRKDGNIVTEGNELKAFVEEHLKTGYPDIHEKLLEFREALSQLQKEKNFHGIKDMFSHLAILRDNLPKPIKQLREQRLESFIELADNFLRIALKVKMGEPLLGSCQLCPKIHIIKTK